MGTDVALNGTGQQQHAQLVNGATYDDVVRDHPSRDAMIQQFFNTAVFANPNSLPRGFYGTVGRNIISGPATNRTDLSLMKDIVVREAVRLQLRGEFFNASEPGDSRRAEYVRIVRDFRPDHQRQFGPRNPVGDEASLVKDNLERNSI